MIKFGQKLRRKIELMTIDPGIYSLGYAYWEDGNPDSIPTVGLVRYKQGGKVTWHQQAQLQAGALEALMIPLIPYVKLVLCEWPEYYGQNLVKTTNKLCFMVGSVARIFPIEKFQTVTPMQWKGQLKKEVIVRRVKEHYEGEEEKLRNWEADIFDAVGIGLWKMGVL